MEQDEAVIGLDFGSRASGRGVPQPELAGAWERDSIDTPWLDRKTALTFGRTSADEYLVGLQNVIREGDR